MASATRHSSVHDALARLNPRWGEIGSMPVALDFGDSERESALKERVAICDLSALNRFGVKGSRAAKWLRDHGIAVPRSANSWSHLPKVQGLVARLGTSEFLVEDGPSGSMVETLRASLNSGSDGLYPVVRQDAAFTLTGSRAKEVMLQTCGLDFDSVNYGERPVFFTRVALISALVLPQVDGDTFTFRLWCSYPYGLYLWEELNEIVEEFGGGVVGISALFEDR